MTELLLVGEIGKPHGLSGEVYVVRISDDPRRFDPGSELIHADGRTLTIGSARSHRDRFLVRFEGIDSRDDAVRLRGPLYVPSDRRRELDEEEFWTQDVVGCRVVTVDGDEVGTATGVRSSPAQDLLTVDTARGERLVPMVKEIVVSVDTTARRIVIDPPEGLFE